MSAIAPIKEMHGVFDQTTALDCVLDVLRARFSTGVMVAANTSLMDLNGFDSLFIAGLIEQLEDRLGVDMDPALILPETFETPATLADALVKSQKS
jgi:acyl carrier protein